MSEVYQFCSVCEEKLTEDEREYNKKQENYYYPVCTDCIDATIDKVFKVLDN
ncbi:hypothetical protein [Bacillus bombysepticus]|uniref:hypothetical protein n=1 Tax=Bacillus bombysepticus TaxID=658666 RepID=UPI00301A2632